MTLNELLSQTGEWLRGGGGNADIVISSRVRLARNIAQHNFLSRLSEEGRQELVELLHDGLEACLDPAEHVHLALETLSELDLSFLVERRLISREHAEAEGERGVSFSTDEALSVMTLEEDHLRMQVIRSGEDLVGAWRQLDALDSLMSEQVQYAFSERLGYLTACPTNVGTGMRASVMLHLPAVVMTGEMEKVFRAVLKINLAVRGLYGEGTQATGDFYQISNQVTLGVSEAEILERLGSVVPQIVLYERKAREALLRDSRNSLEDRIWRACGLLANARRMGSEEALHLLSAVRMGLHLGIINRPPIETVNRLFLLVQPAHLQKREGRELAGEERAGARARLIREELRGDG